MNSISSISNSPKIFLVSNYNTASSAVKSAPAFKEPEDTADISDAAIKLYNASNASIPIEALSASTAALEGSYAALSSGTSL